MEKVNYKENNSKLSSFIHAVEQSIIVRSIRNGLVNMIPVLTIGAFALIIKSLPIEGYQNFISTFANGLIFRLFDLIFSATFGVLSVYMTYTISRAYMKIKADETAFTGGAVISALIAFFILSGVYLEEFSIENIGPKSMFLAIITGLGASALYLAFDKLLRKRKHYLLSAGADREFNRMLMAFFPTLLVVACFAVLNQLVMALFNVDSFRSLLAAMFDAMFTNLPDGFFKGFFFVFLSSLLWFFGIHGSDTLEQVMQTHFAPVANQTAPVILTKEFFDCFVLIGGCGAAICLLIAILLFSKNRARRGLGYAAAFPMIFNINELMVFGLPIIINPIMLIPFLTVPLVCYTVSYLAIATGIVPMICAEVEWTTPIILGGYTATGSVAGALLQVFNVIIGVLIYLPFVRLLDKRTDDSLKKDYEQFVRYFCDNEAELTAVNLTALSNLYGDVAKSLCADIKHALGTGEVKLAYQPQYDYSGKCIGAEALLRYKHPLHGMIYPPLIVKLAGEGAFLATLEQYVFDRATSEYVKLTEKFGENIKLSVNVTGPTVITQEFLQFCKKYKEDGRLNCVNLCIEITEQAALSLDDEAIDILKSISEMGITLSIDDFSMGSTSLQYLKDSLFDEIKLDGSLVKGLSTHENCREIIQSITGLATSLELTVLAEFVETESEREVLHELGCDRYQGYLYSPAVFID